MFSIPFIILFFFSQTLFWYFLHYRKIHEKKIKNEFIHKIENKEKTWYTCALQQQQQETQRKMRRKKDKEIKNEAKTLKQPTIV